MDITVLHIEIFETLEIANQSSKILKGQNENGISSEKSVLLQNHWIINLPTRKTFPVVIVFLKLFSLKYSLCLMRWKCF